MHRLYRRDPMRVVFYYRLAGSHTVYRYDNGLTYYQRGTAISWFKWLFFERQIIAIMIVRRRRREVDHAKAVERNTTNNTTNLSV